MKRLIFLVLMLFSSVSLAAPSAINITSPIKYQTIFNKNGNVTIKFDINATTLFKLPVKIQLYLNNRPVSEIRYRQASSFVINNLQDGQYNVIVTATGHDGSILTVSEPVKFTFKRKGFIKQ